VRAYWAQLGFAIGAHALRATAATNALDKQLGLGLGGIIASLLAAAALVVMQTWVVR
jgi:hypothetical protein